MSVAAQRRADDERRKESREASGDLNDARLDPIEQGILKQQIIDGVSRDPELGKDHQRDVALIALTRQIERLGDIERRIADLDSGYAGRNPDELVAIRETKSSCAASTTAHTLHSFGSHTLAAAEIVS